MRGMDKLGGKCSEGLASQFNFRLQLSHFIVVPPLALNLVSPPDLCVHRIVFVGIPGSLNDQTPAREYTRASEERAAGAASGALASTVRLCASTIDLAHSYAGPFPGLTSILSLRLSTAAFFATGFCVFFPLLADAFAKLRCWTARAGLKARATVSRAPRSMMAYLERGANARWRGFARISA